MNKINGNLTSKKKPSEEDESTPRSHIYIAGSTKALPNSKSQARGSWKIGHAYCLVDRFFTGPDSYLRTNEADGYWPKIIWKWVSRGRKHEREIHDALHKKLIHRPLDASERFHKETYTGDLKYFESEIDLFLEKEFGLIVSKQRIDWETSGAVIRVLRNMIGNSGTVTDQQAQEALRFILDLKNPDMPDQQAV